MSESKLISLADKLNDASLSSPEHTLIFALDDIGKHGAFKNGKKLLVLALDEGDKGDGYSVSFRQAGMSMSECVALCEVAKTVFLSEMEYIPGSIYE